MERDESIKSAVAMERRKLIEVGDGLKEELTEEVEIFRNGRDILCKVVEGKQDWDEMKN